MLRQAPKRRGWRGHRRRIACLSLFWLWNLAASETLGSEPAAERAPDRVLPVTDPGIYPTPLWAMFQLLPSPEWTFQPHSHYFGLRWRLTPLLYSYVTDARLSRWRSLIAEPVVRHGGSLEWFVAPGYAFGVDDDASHFSARSGLRAYFPLAERGEYLSLSIGGGIDYRHPEASPIAELGIYSLLGGVGIVGTHARFGDFEETSVRLQLGYF